MSETVFTKVDYDLGSLVKYIGLGEIGLPGYSEAFCLEGCQGPRICSIPCIRATRWAICCSGKTALADTTRTIGTDSKAEAAPLW